MRRIILWKGYHSREIRKLIQRTWENNDLLLLFPPKLNEFDSLKFLPEGEIEFAGDWETKPELELISALRSERPSIVYPADPLYGIFTTGTIAKSSRKLVLYSKKNIESSLNGILSLFDIEKLDSIFCYPQPFHTFGLILGYLQSYLRKTEWIPIEGAYHSEQHAQWLEIDRKGLLTLGTPTHFKDLLNFTRQKNSKPRSTYASIVGAALVERDLWRSIRDDLVIQEPSIGYGATEASPGITHLPPGREPLEDGEVGFPLKQLEVTLKPGGGVQFKGDSVCLAKIEDGTIAFPQSITIPDCLEKREDGVFIYKGRTELVLNRGGEKFNLEEMESLLRRQLKVEAVCVSLPHARLGEELGILAQSPSDSHSVYALLRQVYGRDFDSRFFGDTEALPVNASSKVDRGVCRERLTKTVAGYL